VFVMTPLGKVRLAPGLDVTAALDDPTGSDVFADMEI
jgi:hypothetical protein